MYTCRIWKKKTDLIETIEDGAWELREEGRTAVDERGQSFITLTERTLVMYC